MVKTILNEDKTNVNTFELILQGNPINSLMMIQNKNLQEDRFTHTAETTVNGVTITIRNYNNLKIDAVTFRFLDYLLVKMCKFLPYDRKNPVDDDKLSQWQVIKISIADYMKMINATDRKNVKSQIENSLITLQNINLSWTEKIYKKKKADYTLFNTNIVTAYKLIRGGYYIQFDLKFLRYLSSFSYIMPFSSNLFKINLHKHPLAYLLARKLLLHLNMNQTKNNSNIISVKSLIESLNLPKYGEIISSNSRDVTRRIIKPVERDITYLKEINFLDDWSYQNQNPKSYKEWSKSNISFIIKSYPTKNDHK